MGSRAMIQGHLLKKKKTVVANLVFIFFLAGLYFPLLYSLPIQFQSIDNDSASHSGIRLIPLVLGISIFTMVSNSLISLYNHHLSMLVLGPLLGTAGVVLIYTVDINSSAAKWIGFEALTAAGVGLCLQIPIISNQGLVTASDIPTVTAMTLFFETIGQALFVAASEAAFTNRLVLSLPYNAPSISPMVVLAAGATQLRDVFHPSDLHGILLLYLDGLKVNHAVSIACGGLATLVSLAMAAPAGAQAWRTRVEKPHLP